MARVAAIMDVGYSSAEVDVRGTFPWGLGVTDIACQDLTYTLDIESEAPRETIRELAEQADAQCYVALTVAEQVPVSMTVVHNGQTL